MPTDMRKPKANVIIYGGRLGSPGLRESQHAITPTLWVEVCEKRREDMFFSLSDVEVSFEEADWCASTPIASGFNPLVWE